MNEYKFNIEIKTYEKIKMKKLKEEIIETIAKHIESTKEKWHKPKLRF